MRDDIPDGIEIIITVLIAVAVSVPVLAGSGVPVTASGDPTPRIGAAGTTASTSGAVFVEGTLTFDDGTSVDGWKVMADGGGNHYFTFAAAGNFSIEVAPNTTYNLKYEQYDGNGTESWPRDGRPDIAAIGEVVVGTANESIGEHRLPAAYLLNVTVVDRDGNPIEGAEIHVAQFANGARSSNDAVTNANGTARWVGSDRTGLELGGDVSVHASGPPGFGDNRTELTVTGNRSLAITLPPTADVSGRMYEADGDPAAHDALVWRGRGGRHDAENVTADGGEFSAELAENTTYGIEYYQNDPRTETDTAFPKDGSVDVQALGLLPVGTGDVVDAGETLPRGHDLTVTVVDRDGNPIEGTTVHVVSHEGVPGTDDAVHAHVEGSTNASGELVHPESDGPGFEVNGTTHVDVEAPSGSGYARNGTTLDVSTDEHLTVVLREAVGVSGRLEYADGSAAAGWRLYAQGIEGTPSEADDQTDATGAFATSVAANGTYSVEFVQQNDSRARAFPKDGRPDLQVVRRLAVGTADVDLGTVALRRAHLVNVSVETQDGTPVTDAEVTVGQVDRSRDIGVYEPAALAGDGEVVMPGAGGPGVEINGTLYVEVHPVDGGLASTRAEFEVGSRRNVTVVVREAASVSGWITDRAGTPVADAHVVFDGSDGAGDWEDDVTAAGGNFSATLVRNGTYNVEFRQDDPRTDGDVAYPDDGVPDVYLIDRRTFDADADLGEVRLPAGRDLNVTVVNSSGAPIADARVDVIHGNDGSGTGIYDLPTDADGRMYHPGSDGIGLEVDGVVDVRVDPPSGSGYLPDDTRIEVSGDRNLTVVLAGRVDVGGRILESDGDPAANDSLALFADGPLGGQARFAGTDADGNFSTAVASNTTHDVQYYQARFTGAGEATSGSWPRDDSPDVAALGRLDTSGVTGAVDLGTTQLPAAHTLNVTVVDEDGSPVENASVSVRHHDASGPSDAGFAGIPTDGDGLLDLDVYDGSGALVDGPPPGIEVFGNVTVEVRPPEDATRFVDRTYARTLTVTDDRGVTITLEDTTSTVAGRILEPDGSPAAGDLVVGTNRKESVWNPVETDAGGNYSVRVPDGTPVSVGVVQRNGTSGAFAPRDGVVDVYEFAEVNVSADTDLATTTLPAGHVLNVTVVDGSGVPVENASAVVSHESGPNVDAVAFVERTDAEGRYRVGNATPGIEVAGNVTVRVRPPEDATRFVDRTYARNLTVTDGREVTVRLNESLVICPGCDAPTDPDGDGLREDADGNGRLGFNDVVVLFEHLDDPAVADHASAYDFNGNGRVDYDDAVSLFEEI